MTRYKLIKTELSQLDGITELNLAKFYQKVRKNYQNSFLMEANDYLPDENCHSFLGFHSLSSFIVKEDSISSAGKLFKIKSDLKTQARQIINQYLSDFIKDHTPVNYQQEKYLGLYGYLAYDSVRHFEPLDFKQPAAEAIPLICYHLYEYLIVKNVDINEVIFYRFIPAEANEEEAATELAQEIKRINQQNVAVDQFKKEGQAFSNLDDEEHRQIINKAKEHIQRGDIFQIVPSRSFTQNFSGDDFLVYQKLKEINPSPYLYYYQYQDFAVFGSSPESNLIVNKGKAYLHPIAGTYPNKKDDAEKQLQIAAMRSDPKENSEHLMLVDLARNDLSKNCLNVRVHEFMKVEEFSHVLHLVSLVGGELMDNVTCFELLSDTFPAGTLSGAPKIRAMELIDELEPDRREFYGGAIGYLGFNNECIHAIMIRSFLSRNKQLIRRAGGGVVSESQVESEIQEVINKLGALAEAIELANTENQEIVK